MVTWIIKDDMSDKDDWLIILKELVKEKLLSVEQFEQLGEFDHLQNIPFHNQTHINFMNFMSQSVTKRSPRDKRLIKKKKKEKSFFNSLSWVGS